MKEKVCCIFNIATHYRAPIFKLMDKELGCDFFFGDTLNNKIKTIDYNILQGFKKEVRNKNLRFYGYKWQKGVWQLIFKRYTHYIITGDPSVLSSWVLLILAKLTGKKVFAWTHGLKKPVENKGDYIKKTFYRLCHKILLYGDYSKNIMLKEGFKSDKLIPIYNSLDYQKQLSIRKNISNSNQYQGYFGNQSPVLIYIGRIQKSKKLDLLVEAVKALKNDNTNCNLVIIGEDVDGNDIPKLVKDYNLEKNVWFYGPCYDEEKIGQLLYDSDVCITPGLIGLTAIHSLTYGTPVITNDSFSSHGPEFEAITTGVTGDFFKTDNVENLCSKIIKWINLDNEERLQVRQESYRIIDERYNPFYQVKIIKELISN